MAKNKRIAYKGFDKNLRCRETQYTVGKTHTHAGAVVPCHSGLHACPEPIDVLAYYYPGTSRFCVVEASGTVKVDDEKIACKRLKVLRELSVSEFAKAAVESRVRVLGRVYTTLAFFSEIATIRYEMDSRAI